MDAEKLEKYLEGNFWFKNLKRILWNGEPLRLKSKEYREKYPNITLKSLDTFSDVDFLVFNESKKNVQELGETINSIEELLTNDYKKAFWAVNAGNDTYRVMGRNFAMDLTIQNYIDSSKAQKRELVASSNKMLENARLAIKKTNYAKKGAAIPSTDEDSEAIKTVESKTTIQEFLKLMSAERLTADPALVLALVPEESIDRSKLSIFAQPVLAANGTKYYDPAFIKDDKPTISPSLVDGTNTYGLGTEIKLTTAQNIDEFNAFMERVGKNLKIKLIPNASMNKGDVNVRQRSTIRNAGRAMLDSAKYRLNYRKNAIEKSFEVEYSSQGSREEQIYVVLKEMGRLVCERSFEDVESSFGKEGVIGLPQSEEYEKAKNILQNAAASLAAAQLVGGFLPRSVDTAQLIELYKLDAMKELAKLDKDNEWAVGMLGAILSNAMNNAFANGVVYPKLYEVNTGSTWGKAKTFLSSMFSKKKKTFNGILTRFHAPTKENLDAKFGPQQKFETDDLNDEQYEQAKIEENNKESEQAQIVTTMARRKRDWKSIAKMVQEAQEKNESLENIIKAIETHKSGKEQTKQDKENIKEFFNVIGYVSKLGDQVFARENERIANLTEDSRAQLNDASVENFANIQEWLKAEQKFNGINSLSQKLHEYETRKSKTSRDCTEIYEIYFDLAKRIINEAANSEESSLRSGKEIGPIYIKLESVNGYEDGMVGSKVMTKKLAKFIPKKDQEKIKAQQQEKARSKKEQKAKQKEEDEQISYEELILLEIAKAFDDYKFLDKNASNTTKLLEVMLKQELIPAKVGEVEENAKRELESRLNAKEKSEIENAANILVEQIKKDADECRDIEGQIRTRQKLPKELQELKDSINLQAKKGKIRSYIEVKLEGDVPQTYKDIVENAVNNNKKEQARLLNIKKSIVNHSDMDMLFTLTDDLLYRICKPNKTLSEEEEADRIVDAFKSRQRLNTHTVNRTQDRRGKAQNKAITQFRENANREKGKHSPSDNVVGNDDIVL